MSRFIAMNQFSVDPARGGDFEEHWRQRESYLDEVPGFQSFVLLRSDEPGEYISHSTWESREAFEACVTSDATRERVDQDIAVAKSAGATGTPTFFINGIMLAGSRPEADFVEIIEAELARLDSTP